MKADGLLCDAKKAPLDPTRQPSQELPASTTGFGKGEDSVAELLHAAVSQAVGGKVAGPISPLKCGPPQ
eukprot:10995731-Lingulodinium_polyedra.AAC.1